MTELVAKRALYFGCRGVREPGHYLQEGRITIYTPPDELPWSLGDLDSGLLRQGKHRDNEDGRVFWTCAGKGAGELWFAFFWWDNSGDSRGGSNSGFYVKGFTDQAEAFAHALAAYPEVAARQHNPLVLQP